MPVSSLDIDPSVYPPVLSIQRTSGRPLDVQTGVLCNRGFGMASPTDAYFDPVSVDAGEGAQLGWDGARGRFFLQRGVGVDLHAMARPEHAAAHQAARAARWAAGRPNRRFGAR